MNSVCTAANLSRRDRPSELTGWARRALIREAAPRPMATLGKLQRSTDQGKSVFKANISRVVHKSDLYFKVARRKPLLRERHKKSCLQFAPSHLGNTGNVDIGERKKFLER